MNTSKVLGVLLLVIGIIALILFAAADILGIGENPHIFGTWQIGGCIIGGVAAVLGLVLILRKNRPTAGEEPGASN